MAGRHRVLRESPGSPRLLEEFQRFSRGAVNAAHQLEPWIPFLQTIARSLREFFDCDVAALWFVEGGTSVLCEAGEGGDLQVHHRALPEEAEGSDEDRTPLDRFCLDLLAGRVERTPPFFNRAGIFFINDTSGPARVQLSGEGGGGQREIHLSGPHRSLVLAPLHLGDWGRCLVILKSAKEGFFPAGGLTLVEMAAQTVRMSATHCRTQGALRERVKELGCLYRISKIVETPGISLEEILSRTAAILPPAWQYPKIAHGRVVLDGRPYGRSDFEQSWQRQSARITLHGEDRGVVEVAYSQKMPALDEGPFLKEERHLIEAVAVQLAQIVERKKAEEERARLREQLRHADRLATIGQLAAGVAHEFNEPLGNILGFAELVLKDGDLARYHRQDLQKIIDAALYAREVVRKLMWFARGMPPQRTRVSLNSVIDEGLYLVEARCRKAGIDIVRDLEPDLPEIVADPAQLRQVLMNLTVNAIQAMPAGGTIRISTESRGEEVCVQVEDTGSGMSEEVRSQIFLPFFTTKDVDEGTGLGLAVVHGIVASHGGTVEVDSAVGEGSSFRVRLPLDGGPEERDGA